MLTLSCPLVFVATLLALQNPEADAVFSGPQVGERLPPITAQVALGPGKGETVDFVKQAGKDPLLLVFVHEANRPSIAVMRTIVEYAFKPARPCNVAVIFLGDDATELERFIKRAAHALPEKAPLAISKEGREGPGTYGLNRNVTLTVLVAQDAKVTANFAIVQPSLAVDAPKIAAEIAKACGEKRMPTVADLGIPREEMKNEVNLRPLLTPIIRKNATPEQVAKAAKELEEYVAKNDAARRELGRIAKTIVDAGKVEDYGTPDAQSLLREWAKKFGTQEKR
jgi:hypothetical protein